MKTKILLLTLLMAFNSFGEGGDRTGSGGDALVCFKTSKKKEIESVRLWDYVEAELEHDIEIELEGLTYINKVQEIIKRYDHVEDDHFNLKLSELYKNTRSGPFNGEKGLVSELEKMELGKSEIIRLTGVNAKLNYKLRDIRDMKSRIEVDSELCSVSQIAMQEREQRSVGGLIKIHRSLWNYLSDTDKAGLINHEVLLLYMNLLNPEVVAKKSTSVRDFNIFLSQKSFKEEITTAKYLVAMMRSKFIVEQPTFELNWDEKRYLINFKNSLVEVDNDNDYRTHYLEGYPAYAFKLNISKDKTIRVKKNFMVKFHKHGEVKELHFEGNQLLPISLEDNADKIQTIEFSGEYGVTLSEGICHSDQNNCDSEYQLVVKGDVSKAGTIEIFNGNNNGKVLPFTTGSYRASQWGNLLEIILSKPTTLITVEGEKEFWWRVEFDEDGYAIIK